MNAPPDRGASFPCPYLGGPVDLSPERERHVASAHPELADDLRTLMGETLADPDEVRRSRRAPNARLFSRWYDALRGGKHVVVVVVSDAPPSSRRWIVTAYVARALAQGAVGWKRN